MTDLKTHLLDALRRSDRVAMPVPELLRRLRLPLGRLPELQGVLADLERSGQVARIKGDHYILPPEADLIPGRIRMNRQGKGFLQPDDPSLKEIAIPENATGTALHEDRVLVRREVRARGLRPGAPEPLTGEVVRILQRRRTHLVGTLQRGRQFLYVIPDDPRIPHDIYVPEPAGPARSARPGDKVVVALREWESRQTSPEGEILEVLGAPDAEGVDMLSVLRQYSLPHHFPKEALQEARAVGSAVDPRDLQGRVDCRRHRVITIDPDDAKDFDDAICVESAGDGQWRLWVHIADVSHYVKPGTALDVEARQRGNSTYLVDRVIPMLPEALSNELCSLKPGVDRLTKCVEFLVAADGRVLAAKFFAAVIHSQRRFTYQEALAVLQGPVPSDPIGRMLHDAHQIAQRIRRRRFQNGSLELDFPEAKIRLDERGRVLRIERTENDVSHQLIEEFMLLANEAVAARLLRLGRPAVHRVHEPPEERRLLEYREEVLSHNVPCGNLARPGEVQKLLQRLRGLPIGPALKIGLLKSLMRARYAVEPLGHYGLAKRQYTHFTSPIRRYADLVVHRALFDAQPGHMPALREVAEHISMTERNSADAERDSKDVKLFAFLKAQLRSGQPETYPALVTDVRNFGFFVDVPGLAMSGLVPLSAVPDDFFVFDAGRNHLVGRRTRRIIRLGDQVRVQVAKVDSFKKQVDFRLADGRPSVAPASGRGRPQPGGVRRPQAGQGGASRRGPSHGGQLQRGPGPGGQSSGGRPQGGRPQGGRPQGGRPQGGRPQGGRPQGGRPQGGRPQGGRPQDRPPERSRDGGRRRR